MIRHDTAKRRSARAKSKASEPAPMTHAGSPLVTIHTANLARLARLDEEAAERLVKSLCQHFPGIAKSLFAARLGSDSRRAAAGRVAKDGAPKADESFADECWLHHSEIRDCGDGEGLCVWQWWECVGGGGYWQHYPIA
jgi:hypothetical protein